MLIAGVVIAYLLIAGVIAAWLSWETQSFDDAIGNAILGAVWPLYPVCAVFAAPVLIVALIAALVRKAVGR